MAIFSITGAKIYVLSSVAGLRAWVDYIPVGEGGGGRPGSFDDAGYMVPSEALGSVSGLTAWVDYIPVYEVTGQGKWQYDDAGYIPIDPSLLGGVTPPSADAILLEGGDYLLLESGSKLLLEAA
jgi:hypothetical protein